MLFTLLLGGCGARTGPWEPEGVDVTVPALPSEPVDATPTSEPVDAAVAAGLDGLRWELPCTGPAFFDTLCTTTRRRETSATMGGEAGGRYEVTLRFRGVVERQEYRGGRNDGAFWQIDGTPADSYTNIYRLIISSPPQRYYLNRGRFSAIAVVAMDYQKTISIAAGATVRLEADAVNDTQLRNRDDRGQPLVVADVPPAPAPFDGQFIQMDVTAVARIR